MSTRATICIKLHDYDLGKEFYLKNHLGFNTEHKITTPLDARYMCVYCHHDGYIEKPGLGYFLPRKYQTYDEVRDFILQGDRSGLNDPYSMNEPIFDVKPEFIDSVNEKIPEEYFYLFDDDKWYVKDIYDHKDFVELDYKPKIITLNEREAVTVKFIIDKYIKIHDLFMNIPESHDLIYMRNVYTIEKKFKDLNVGNEE